MPDVKSIKVPLFQIQIQLKYSFVCCIYVCLYVHVFVQIVAVACLSCKLLELQLQIMQHDALQQTSACTLVYSTKIST